MLGRPGLRGADLALAVERVAERVHDPPEQLLTHGDVEQALGPLDRVAFHDLVPLAEQHGAHVVGLEVQRQSGDVVRELEHLERHAVLEAVDAADPVRHGQHRPDLLEVGGVGVQAFDPAAKN